MHRYCIVLVSVKGNPSVWGPWERMDDALNVMVKLTGERAVMVSNKDGMYELTRIRQNVG